jgi:hypothetical protein
MDELSDFYKWLDEGDFDCRSESQINSKLQEVSKQLHEKEKTDRLKISELERQAFAIRKSFDTILDEDKGTLDGLCWQMSGTQTLEDGQVKPLHWPNVQGLSEEDFQYFEKRYKECKNLYAKVEFGLLTYFGNKTAFSKHTDFKKGLFAELFQLSKQYLENARQPKDKNYYTLYFFSTLKSAFKVAEKAKLSDQLNEIIEFVFKTHQEWDTKKDGSLRIILDLSSLMSDYFKLFKKSIDYGKVIDKNLQGAQELEKSHVWGAVYIVDKSIEIKQKLNLKYDDLIKYKAELYEKLSSEAEEQGNMACITFSEDALRLYQQLNDKDKIIELENRYTEQRGKFELSKIHQELPEEFTRQIQENILKTISESDETQIIYHLIITPWYDRIENIEKNAIESKQHTVLLSMIGTSILDKFGNTIDKFHSDEEIDKHNFWQTYGFNFQIGTQTMHQFFIESYQAKKITYDSVLNYLESTWFNEFISRKYHGEIVKIKPIDIIKPGLKRFFQELDSFFKDNTHQFDYVTTTDSLVLKVESIIRYFCEKIGLATFKTRQKGSDKLVMEKLLDDLLVDIKNSEANPTGFDEEDRIFIKYVLTEKAGLNLRNQVAHGLLDVYEYSFSNLLVVLSIILKLSKYKFTPIP